MSAVVADRAPVQKMTFLTVAPKPRLNFLSAPRLNFLSALALKELSEEVKKSIRLALMKFGLLLPLCLSNNTRLPVAGFFHRLMAFYRIKQIHRK
jgi:hypothetical protein